MNLVNQNKELIASTICLEAENIDTDQIIPARYMKEPSFQSLGQNVFIDQRKAAKSKNHLHPFDNPIYAKAKILCVAKNFGCGSSREHAPQALKRWGIDVVVGESFGEIFRGNCAAIGLACLTIAEKDSCHLRAYLGKHPKLQITVNFAQNEIQFAEQSVCFSMLESVRQQILSGQWNALEELMTYGKTIEELYQRLPYTTNLANAFKASIDSQALNSASAGGIHE